MVGAETPYPIGFVQQGEFKFASLQSGACRKLNCQATQSLRVSNSTVDARWLSDDRQGRGGLGGDGMLCESLQAVYKVFAAALRGFGILEIPTIDGESSCRHHSTA